MNKTMSAGLVEVVKTKHEVSTLFSTQDYYVTELKDGEIFFFKVKASKKSPTKGYLILVSPEGEDVLDFLSHPVHILYRANSAREVNRAIMIIRSMWKYRKTLVFDIDVKFWTFLEIYLEQRFTNNRKIKREILKYDRSNNRKTKR